MPVSQRHRASRFAPGIRAFFCTIVGPLVTTAPAAAHATAAVGGFPGKPEMLAERQGDWIAVRAHGVVGQRIPFPRLDSDATRRHERQAAENYQGDGFCFHGFFLTFFCNNVSTSLMKALRF